MPNSEFEASDEALAEGAQGGDLISFEQLVQRYEKRLFSFLYHRLGNVADAEDVTQKTFVLAFHNIGRYNSQYRFVTWLYTIAKRQANTHYRKQRSTVELSPELSDQKADPASQAAASDTWSIARKCLSEVHFTILWLRYADDLSVRQIAAETGKSISNVKVILHRARLELGKELHNNGISI